ncbi:MAG TPA: hypothetical protein DD850_13650, partial [Erwinia persicina]|nr:hypothetical protein [Erwinia persicina]
MAQFVYSMHRVGKVVPPKRHILKNISLSFFPGAKIGVLGLNGAGKSTLLRIMAGNVAGKERVARPQPGGKNGDLAQGPEPAPEEKDRAAAGVGAGRGHGGHGRPGGGGEGQYRALRCLAAPHPGPLPGGERERHLPQA